MGARPTALILLALFLAGCSPAKKTESTSAAAKGEAADAGNAKAGDAAAEKKEASGDVSLTAAELANLQIAVTPVAGVSYRPDSVGLGIVLGHEGVAQAVSELETTAAAARQSGSALARAKRLAGGPGALGLDAVDVAARQFAADQASLALARRKLAATVGLHFPWGGSAATRVIEHLANGSAKLARVTFPPGELGSAPPKSLNASLLDGSASNSTWVSHDLWEAPQDPAVPGRSYFALFRTADMPEGARLQAVAGRDGGQEGVLVPSSAIVISNGQFWVYLKKSETAFSRVPIDMSRPLADGYFVSDALAPGDAIVTSGAGLLLARQMNAGSEGAD
jgi:hypothetical protein